jgi:hypothetical protein
MNLKQKLQDLCKGSRSLGGLPPSNDLLRRSKARKAEVPTEVQEKKISTLRQKLKAGRKDTTPEMSETKRICALPIELEWSEHELDKFNYMILQAQAYDDGFRLFDCQSMAMSDYVQHGGGFFPIGVGWGKTLISLFIAAHAYMQGILKSILLVPPSVYSQLVNRDIPWARTKIHMPVPFIKLGKATKAKRKALSESGRPGCYILPYSMLSTADSVELLNAIEPGLIICDEAHKVKNRRASRTRRFINYVQEKHPQLVCLSGTITSKGIADYQHLIRLALGSNCPIPRSPIMAGEWGTVIDSGVFCTESYLARPLIPLLHWARSNFPKEDFPEITSGFRRAYKKRLISAPGVVATGDAEIGVSLVLTNNVVDMTKSEGHKELTEHIKNVDELYLTPNGDEIEHAIHAFKWKHELSAGFYNELTWPVANNKAEEAMIRGAKEHHAAGQAYAKELRRFLQEDSRPGYDTPMLAGLNMSQHKAKYVGSKLYDLWKYMKSLEFDGMPQRIKNQIRVCPYKRDAAVAWASCLDRGEGALLWVWHKEMGRWLYEGLQEAGLDAKYAGAGSTLFDPANIEKTKSKIVVTSLGAHSIGKNLQPFQNQIYVQWPRPPETAEQSLGRTHRNGQQADELIVHTLNSILFDHEVFAACLNDTLYIQQTTGSRQKLIKASYDPMPKIFPPEVLRERGMEPENLDREMRKAMEDRFGIFA